MQRTVSYPVLSTAVLAGALLAACSIVPSPRAAEPAPPAPAAEAPEASAAEAASATPASRLDAAKTAPLPPVDAGRLALGAATYGSRFTTRGQEVEMTAVRTLERVEDQGEAVLRVTDTVEGPMSGEDLYVLQADSLRPVSRQAKQGPATIEIDYGSREVTGTLTAPGQEIPVEVELEAPVFGDSSALDTAITALPLAEGYRTTVRSVEIGVQQAVRVWSVEVESVESVEVPAGSFETFRVALEPLDGEPGGRTLWIIEETPRRVVKAESELPPQAGGGTAVTELVSIAE